MLAKSSRNPRPVTICKWATNLDTAPKDVKAVASENHGYLIADYLVAKRKSQNAARAQRLQDKKKKEQPPKNALKRMATTHEKFGKMNKASAAVAKQPAAPSASNGDADKTPPKPVPAAKEIKVVEKAAPPKPEGEPFAKRRKVTITIENATESDIRALLNP